MLGTQPIGSAGVDDLARLGVVRVIANVFDEEVSVGANLPLYEIALLFG